MQVKLDQNLRTNVHYQTIELFLLDKNYHSLTIIKCSNSSELRLKFVLVFAQLALIKKVINILLLVKKTTRFVA